MFSSNLVDKIQVSAPLKIVVFWWCKVEKNKRLLFKFCWKGIKNWAPPSFLKGKGQTWNYITFQEHFFFLVHLLEVLLFPFLRWWNGSGNGKMKKMHQMNEEGIARHEFLETVNVLKRCLHCSLLFFSLCFVAGFCRCPFFPLLRWSKGVRKGHLEQILQIHEEDIARHEL